jgi:D-glycero-D-manno-heptose 1,7-bisphosphate phosphatase
MMRGRVKKPAVFLDRDGTICEEVGFLKNIEDFRLISGSGPAIRDINAREWYTVVISNQSGIARGFMNEKEVDTVNQHMLEILRKENAKLDGIYFCPHHPKGNPPYNIHCKCRKPSPGMLLQAQQDLNIDLEESVVIGDKYSDVKTGHNLNASGILLLTGFGKRELRRYRNKWERPPDYIAKNLSEAIRWWFNGRHSE